MFEVLFQKAEPLREVYKYAKRRERIGMSGSKSSFVKRHRSTSRKPRYPGFKPGMTVLPRGFVKRKEHSRSPAKLSLERDVAVSLRDGTIHFIRISFAPSVVPTCQPSSPGALNGKEGGLTLLDDFPFRAGVAKNASRNCRSGKVLTRPTGATIG